MTIIIFSAFYPPHLGGIEFFTLNLAKALSEKTDKVFVVTSGTGTEVETRHDGRVCVIEIPSKIIINNRFPFIVPNAQMRRIWKAINKIKIDLVAVQARYYPLTLAGLIYAKKHDLPAILIDHSSDYLSGGSYFANALIHFYEKCCNCMVKRLSPRCFGVSRKSQEWLNRLGMKVAGIIPNSVNPEFAVCDQAINFRALCGLSQDDFVVVHAGRLVEEKGLQELLEAFSELDKDYPSIHLLIAGSGPLEEEVANYGNRSVHYLGPLSHEELLSLLKQGDCLCLPSRYPEGFPTILLEAALCECALIYTDNGGAEEMIPNDNFGIIIEETSSKTIEYAVLDLYLNPSKLDILIKNAKANVLNNYTWDKTAQLILDMQ